MLKSLIFQTLTPTEVLFILLPLAFDRLHDDTRFSHCAMIVPEVIKETATANSKFILIYNYLTYMLILLTMSV